MWCGRVIFDARSCRSNVGMLVGMDVDGAVVIGACPGAMVDEDGMASPAESGAVPTVDTEGRSDYDCRTEADSGGDDESGTRCIEDNCRAVDGDVYVSGIDRLDLDVSAVVGYVVVWGRCEIAVVVGGLTLTLDGVHDIVALNENGVAESAGPLGVAGHHVENGGEGEEGEDAGVPREIVGLDGLGEGVAGEVGVLLGPGGGVGNLLPKRGGGENLGEERIGIEGDALDELVELLRGDGGWWWWLVLWLCLGVSWRGRWWWRLVLRVCLLLVGGRRLADDGGLGECDWCN